MKVFGIQDLDDLLNQEVLLRADFNVPLLNGEISDSTRIDKTLPTIGYLLKKNSRLVICSHLGRPKEKKETANSLLPVASYLKKHFPIVHFAFDCIGEEVLSLRKNLKAGEILLLENTRYYKEETSNDFDFSRNLAGKADYFVNDAFSVSHRKHSSVSEVCQFVKKSFAGFLLQKEIRFLGELLSLPESPFCVILGGAKVSDKMGVIKSFLGIADTLIIGGAMANTFHKALGYEVGSSLVEEDYLKIASEILALAQKKKTQILLPDDVQVSSSLKEEVHLPNIHSYQEGEKISSGFLAVDIGEVAIQKFTEAIQKAKTVLWNGPMGVFEIPAFSQGTKKIAQAVANCGGKTIVGGGDSVSALNQFKLVDKIDFISTGGGATLEFLEGKILPGIASLSKK